MPLNNQGVMNNYPNNNIETNYNNAQPNNQMPSNNQGVMNNYPNNNIGINYNNNQPNNYNPQYNQYQNNMGNMQINNTPNTKPKDNKKTMKTIAIGVVLVIVVIIGIIILVKLTKSNAKKTLTCTTHHAVLGVYYDEKFEYFINDGSASVKYTQKVDLSKSTGLEGDIEGWVDEKIEASKQDCNSTSGCKFDYKYSKGKSLEITLSLSEEVNKSLEGMSAEEIYNQQKTKHESGEIDGSVYVCN